MKVEIKFHLKCRSFSKCTKGAKDERVSIVALLFPFVSPGFHLGPHCVWPLQEAAGGVRLVL